MRLLVRLWVMVLLAQSQPGITPPGNGRSGDQGVLCPHCRVPQSARPPRHTCSRCRKCFLVRACTSRAKESHYMVNGGDRHGWRCDVDNRVMGYDRPIAALVKCPERRCGCFNVRTGAVMTCEYCGQRFRTS
ncbi:hypothetical protein [Nonomuraea soli]|uniref:Uncharacterized protein n=1 Tax=Nonomuraea soli TaxID=1032476 RepID=A0A7W0HRC8_9ACTN|nr:hypothetical protein [Nonomuraea soli]MBA2892717.1 hypothetical protein [Nonomuraea soli]